MIDTAEDLVTISHSSLTLIHYSIHMTVKTGELVAVVGTVGSGKSSLISACLGEMERLSGELYVKVTAELKSYTPSLSCVIYTRM